MKLYKYSLLLYLIFSSPAVFAMDIIKYPWLGSNRFLYQQYYLAVLKLALDKSSNKYGSYQLVRQYMPMHQKRAIDSLAKNKFINILWTMTSQERETQLRPIRIPLLNGLGGCRIFLINEYDQVFFSQIKTLEQLKQLIVGQGKHWPDIRILEANHFNVIAGSNYDGLFGMLQHHRFDYFPRALHEPWIEQASFPKLAVEKTLLLQYPAPYFFFVNKQNTRLEKRIKFGLLKAIKDGSFSDLFNNHPVTSTVIAQANIKNRAIFHLKNPFLTVATAKVLAQRQNKVQCN